jgi:Amt family ammonium transporter
MEHGKAGTTAQAAVRRLRRSLFSRYSVLLVAAVILGSLLTPCFADEPAPDPSGTATGDRTTTTDAAGNPFVVSAPPDPSAPDYAQKKKDYDDFETQLAKEPLAGKLADNLGHVRIATNFSWTLLTGYLVLFMQAGFALLTCGLVRKKNAAHLMMLNFAAYVFAFLAYYAVGCLSVRRRGYQCRPGKSRWRPDAQSFPPGQRPMGISGRQGFFPFRSRLRCGQSLSDVV